MFLSLIMKTWIGQEKHKKYAQYLKGFKQQPCYCYDFDGNLIAEFSYIGFRESSIPLKVIMPSGAIVVQN